jgi:tRNA (mo5U34)-methyltransferase
MKPLDISELRHSSEQFERTLDDLKQSLAPAFEWYPYHSLTNFIHLSSLLTGPRRNLLELAGRLPVLDIGCADGDLSFFLEGHGVKVTAVDHPRSNHNGMRGVRTLRESLNSSLEIVEADLDAQFNLGTARFGLAFLLGALYHLKNPFHTLETLARHANYCVLSTRIMRYLPGGKVDAKGVPIAYLLGESELNADNSNFWIFTEAALLRLFARANWRVLDYYTVGDYDSDPVSTKDQRAFCLLQSTYALADAQLIRGWHAPEDFGWRWTEKHFEAVVTPTKAGASVLKVKVFVPAALVLASGTLQLQIAANGTPLLPEIFTQEGEYVLERNVPDGASYHLAFTLSSALPPDVSDPRERGLIVASLFVA